MPLYEVEQYEIHSTKYRVIADSPADAIAQVLDGEADQIDDSMEFIEVADDIGLPLDEYDELAEKISKLGVPVDEHFIPSIRSISAVNVTGEGTPTTEAER
ncbi:hypothetical protein [Novipirellula artificiosorum]|uniref:Uncharacterized protein n=1 Tax=Novipirellula artificiosorum TaxID=2528016 RepID=A0A5C6DZ00_9BACT|nr:hypothetical protein [Novipirellula artificiosorum]TWU41868.1 hypothetical protein Poly41_01610 [Novipirellula artificiosorum]